MLRRRALELLASGTRLRSLHASPFAAAKAPAAPAKKKKAGPAAPAGTGVMDRTTATGVNLLKSGSDPKLGPDEDYPEWLHTLAAPLPTAGVLRKRYGDDPESLSIEEARRRERAGGCCDVPLGTTNASVLMRVARRRDTGCIDSCGALTSSARTRTAELTNTSALGALRVLFAAARLISGPALCCSARSLESFFTTNDTFLSIDTAVDSFMVCRPIQNVLNAVGRPAKER